MNLDSPQHYWENVLWPDETKMELFGKKTQHYIWCKKSILSRNHHPNGKVRWREHYDLRPLLLPQGLDKSQTLRGGWICKLTKTPYKRMSGCQSASWSSLGVGLCNRTTTQNAKVNWCQNGSTKRKSTFWSDPVKAKTSTQQKCCGQTSGEPFTAGIWRTWRK